MSKASDANLDWAGYSVDAEFHKATRSQQCVVVSIYVDMCNRARSQMEKSRHTHAQQRGPVSTLGV